MKNAVVIIVYSDFPSDFEICSFRQCVNLLGTHKICLVAPKSLSCNVYTNIICDTSADWDLVRLDDSWFQSIQTYNKLMLSKYFYEHFVEYDFILIYQLDSWVFSDELDEWCAKGYDYIGAPWFSDRGEMFAFAGNGGFSLRKISAFIDILNKREYGGNNWNQEFLYVEHPARTFFRAKIKKFLHRISMLFCKISPRLFIKFNHDFEDMTYAKAFSLLGIHRVAPPHVAAFFSFERFPEILYEGTGHKLPFGCHAFAKYNWAFWKDKILYQPTELPKTTRDSG